MGALTKGLTFPFLLLAIATTLVYMGGLAALQARCYGMGVPGINPEQGAATTTVNAAFGMSDGWGVCSKVFRFWWFVFAFVMATLLGLLLCAFKTLWLHYSRPFWVAMIAISAILMMLASEAFLGMEQMYKYGVAEPWWWRAAWRATLAGAIMSVVSLILLLLGVGTDWERRGSGHHRRGRDEKMTGTTTTTTEQVAVPVGNVRVVDQV